VGTRAALLRVPLQWHRETSDPFQDHSRWEVIRRSLFNVACVRGVSPQKEGTILSLERTFFFLFIRKRKGGFDDLLKNAFSLFIFPRRPHREHSS
jgi:hypothetical protein